MQGDKEPEDGQEIPPEAAELDEQYLSLGTAEEYAELLSLLEKVGTGEGGEDAEVDAAINDWQLRIRDSFPPQPPAPPSDEEAAARTYSFYPLNSTAGGRTYCANLKLDDAFGNLKDRVVRCTQRGLDRVVADQTRCFIRNAQQHGLSWRRTRGLRFPHALPYFDPPPTTGLQRYTEEAGVIAAALHFLLSRPAPGIELLINRNDIPPNGRYWVLGSADVNHYSDDKRHFLINLNGRAMRDGSFTNATWSATIVHEMLHNLGWGHPNGSYNIRMAIENYEACIRGTRFIDEQPDVYPIR